MSKTLRQRPLVLFSLATRGGYNEEATTSLSLMLCTTTFTIMQQHPSKCVP